MKIILIVFLVFQFLLFSQSDGLKQDAQREMQSGRYGEAIDLLNRYISGQPQQSEGYNLRGLCYEKRSQYEMAVYDFRSARKLKPDNREINQNLARATDAWHKLLYNKIEGHRREIAINSFKAINYLEIGKSYKNLGEWGTAEEWYDKYLGMEEASADEVIRYTEILAKNNHLAKGEPILKSYTEQYPTDHRLWSRYGYFLLWMGKNKPAIDAFEKALALKPYFKEAMDGLDQANGKGYIYTVNDTSYKYGKGSSQKQQEYAIDKYYRQLKKDPADNQIRITLIKELLKVNRLEEASQQSSLLGKYSSDPSTYSSLVEEVNDKRNKFYADAIVEYRTKYEHNSEDYDAILKLASYYNQTKDFDSSAAMYSKYLDKYPDDKNIRFEYAKVLASNKEFSDAYNNISQLRSKDPGNNSYILFNAQLNVWNGQDLEAARVDLEKVLQADPENSDALIAFTSLNIQLRDFTTAESYLTKIQSIDPQNENILKLQNDLEFGKLRAEEDKLFLVLEEGRQLAMDGYCPEALSKYEEYILKASPNRIIKKEYADVKVCAKNFDEAIQIYNEILSEEYDLSVDIQRAKVYYYMGDSLKAIEEFSRLAESNPEDFTINLYLGDSYLKVKDYDKAKEIYDNLNQMAADSTIVLDTTNLAQLSLRYNWLPETGLSGLFGGLGSRFALSPVSQYYADNQNFDFSQYGGRLELGLTNFLSIGGTFLRSTISTLTRENTFSAIKGNVFLRLSPYFAASAGIGSLKSKDLQTKKTLDLLVKYEKQNLVSIYGSFEESDARVLLFSPNLIDINYNARIYRVGGFWNHKSGLSLTGYFHFISVSDGNEGNQFRARLGKEFFANTKFGYEYDYQNFGFISALYYTPVDLEAHSVWGEWKILEKEEVKLTLGGKLGYIPSFSFIIREFFGDISYVPFQYFTINGRIGVSSSFRSDTAYNSLSISLSAYWSF